MIRSLKHVDRMASLLLGGATAALSVAPAAAQTVAAPVSQEADTGDEILVSGYRRSLEEAIDMKRNTIGFSDSIIATDIADFPEQNLSEALQRVPGVTIERERGLGTRVNVRGLPSEFTFVSINKAGDRLGLGRPRRRVRHLRVRTDPVGHRAEVAGGGGRGGRHRRLRADPNRAAVRQPRASRGRQR